MALQKCFSFRKIHRKTSEAVTTVPHQDDVCAGIPAQTCLKQEVVLPLGPPDQASKDF